MANVVVSNYSFVKPHFIPELGAEGLSLKEIAASLGIEYKHAKEAYDKNVSDYTGVEISTAVDSGPIRGTVQVMVPHLTTDDAKFFVTQSRTSAGKSYCRFLIECEKVALDPFVGLPPEVKALVAVSRQVQEVKAAVAALEEDKSNTALNTVQKSHIEGLMDHWFNKCGRDGKVKGRMMKAIKATFIQGSANNNKWYHVGQKHYESVIALVNQMGSAYVK